MISEVLNRLDNIQESISHVIKRMKSKHGSKLGNSEVACFARAKVAMNELLPYVENLTSDDNCQYAYTETRKYTEIMMANVVAKRTAEIPYVQQPTFALIKLLTAHIIPDLQFFEKDSGAIEIRYSIQLETPSAEILPVSGETDQLIAAGEIPLGNVEVKNLDVTCTAPNEVGEILAEDKGFAERYKRILGIEPNVFPSVLVSGRRWTFVDRLFRNNERYIQFPVLETFNVITTTAGAPCECIMNEPNLMMVSRMLVRMIYSIRDLALITRKRKLQLFSHAAADDDNEEQNSDDEPSGHDDDDDENADDPPLKKRAAAGSSVTARGIHYTKASGSREKGTNSQSSSLTMANVFQHDRNTLWQRTIVR